MTIKNSINWPTRANERAGFQIYGDVPADFSAVDGASGPPVYLRHYGASGQLETPSGRGASIAVAMPEEWARDLGPLPLDGEPPQTLDN